jgi:hypothetical protein
MKWLITFLAYLIGILALILNIALYITGAVMVVVAICRGNVELGVYGGMTIVGGITMTAAVLATTEI